MFFKILFLRLLFVCFLCFSLNGFAQDYELNGDAIQLNPDCYQLTDNILNEQGSMWNNNQIDLSQSFNLEFIVNFGNDDMGADGIAFVLQNNGVNSLGAIAQGIGYEGISPSLAIEFDTWNNTNLSDLAIDHVAIQSNGNPDHTSTNNLVGPAAALPGGANIEDGQDYTLQIQWDANTQTIEVFVDCNLTITLNNYDLVNQIFMGNPNVWFGFTSSTGGFSNMHTVCPTNFEACCLGNIPGLIIDP